MRCARDWQTAWERGYKAVSVFVGIVTVIPKYISTVLSIVT